MVRGNREGIIAPKAGGTEVSKGLEEKFSTGSFSLTQKLCQKLALLFPSESFSADKTLHGLGFLLLGNLWFY